MWRFIRKIDITFDDTVYTSLSANGEYTACLDFAIAEAVFVYKRCAVTSV